MTPSQWILVSMELFLCARLGSGDYHFWTRHTTNRLVDKLLREDFLEVFRGPFVDVWVAFGTDMPRFGTITCSWQMVRKKFKQTGRGRIFVGYEMNHWYMVQILGYKFKFSDGWMTMGVKPNGIINTRGWKYGLPKEYNTYPLYMDRRERVVAYVVRNVAQIKSLSRLTKRYYTFISVHLDMVHPRMTPDTWSSVMRAKRRLMSLELPVIMSNNHDFKDLCWDSSYERGWTSRATPGHQLSPLLDRF